ncbi:hypothetical protein ANCCEY_08155 [Ancylostoma ceylanicum]|uniref:Protein kinase domain-containing protein n=1 Tax=Ancylostoma ceylanicum TaxID=53326 RepID=A0A0D6LRW2_9BILA|nr:hypothetical protein ANCCEY_08155 [Ancylostoma ceylanicum]
MVKDDPMNDMPKEREDVIKSRKGTYEVSFVIRSSMHIVRIGCFIRLFQILEILGKGSFGAVFRVRRMEDGKDLAMKCESYKVKKQILRHEAKVLEGMRKINSVHFISYEDRGKIAGRFMFVVIRLIKAKLTLEVGKNLWDLRMENPERRFSMATGIRAAEQTLSGIRDLHICGYLHRDIKPPNFAIGREEDGNPHTIYILDFGLCRKYRTDDKDLRYMREKAAFRGTTRYASIGALDMVSFNYNSFDYLDTEIFLKKDQCRKDDVEAWWYMVLEWMIGQLPWKHCRVSSPYFTLEALKNLTISIEMHRASIQGADRAENLLRKERRFTTMTLHYLFKVLKHTPEEYMANIILYIDTLEYNSIPDYDHIAAHLEAAMQAYHLSYSEPLDWDLMTEYKGPRYVKNLDYELK